MKGMMNLLERAGLIRQETSGPPNSESPAAGQAQDVAAPAPEVAIEVRASGTPLNLGDIYTNEGVSPSVYPAERLLRLLDGLSAMDEAIRRTAINAMDAADESWTIADPVADAHAKVKALAVHSQRLELSLQQLEQETQARVDEVRARTEQSVGGIRKQIADLEALAARELDRAEKETAEYEGTLNSAKLQTSRELDEIKKTSTQLQNLANQFGALISTAQG